MPNEVNKISKNLPGRNDNLLDTDLYQFRIKTMLALRDELAPSAAQGLQGAGVLP